MRQTPDELAEDFLQTATEKKMSRRDKARRDFIRNFKLKQLSKKSLKNTIIAERERFLDFQE